VYKFGERTDPWAAERGKLAELDAKFEDECNRIRCERLGIEIAIDAASVAGGSFARGSRIRQLSN